MNSAFEQLCDQSDSVCDIITLQNLMAENLPLLSKALQQPVQKLVRIENVSANLENFDLRILYVPVASNQECSGFITLDEEMYCGIYGITYDPKFDNDSSDEDSW
jgi:hypothetical protein